MSVRPGAPQAMTAAPARLTDAARSRSAGGAGIVKSGPDFAQAPPGDAKNEQPHGHVVRPQDVGGRAAVLAQRGPEHPSRGRRREPGGDHGAVT